MIPNMALRSSDTIIHFACGLYRAGTQNLNMTQETIYANEQTHPSISDNTRPIDVFIGFIVICQTLAIQTTFPKTRSILIPKKP